MVAALDGDDKDDDDDDPPVVTTVTAGEEGWHCVDGLFDGPKSLANRASLYTHMDMLTIVVVRNLAVPGVTVAKG